MVTIKFEYSDGRRFAHIWSDQGVLGTKKILNARLPKWTWLTLPPKYHRLAPWLIKHCGFRWISSVLQDGELLKVLVKDK